MHAQLSADLLVSDPEITVLVDGSGNCIEIEDGLVAIGSGGLYAQSAAKALLDSDMLTAEEIANKAMYIAGELCLYTNHNTVMETLFRDLPTTLVLTAPTAGTKLLLKHLNQKYIESDSIED
jgi:ATP-dependent HslUV protease, peptidase subunit HslV